MAIPAGKQLDRDRDATAREFYARLEAGTAATTRCPACGTTRFPPRARCATCDAPTEWIELPSRGRLHAFTMQERALRFGAPELLVLVELGDVVVPGVMAGPIDERAIGDEVELAADRVDDLGLSVCRFRPAGPAAA
jgi:uncharacterized OB-fold protein